MHSGKLIAVSDKSGHTISILQEIFRLSGRAHFRAARVGEAKLPDEQPTVLLLCDGVIPDHAAEFEICVAEFETVNNSALSALSPVTYSLSSDSADFTARNIRLTQENCLAFELVVVGVIGRVKLMTGGAQWAKESLAAAAAACAAGVPFAETLDALNRMDFTGVKN